MFLPTSTTSRIGLGGRLFSRKGGLPCVAKKINNAPGQTPSKPPINGAVNARLQHYDRRRLRPHIGSLNADIGVAMAADSVLPEGRLAALTA